MSPTEALGILEKVAYDYRGTRAEHDLIDRSIKCLASTINPPAPPKVDEPNKE